MYSNVLIITVVYSISGLAFASELVHSSLKKSANSNLTTETSKYSKYEPFFEACRLKNKSQKKEYIEAISPIRFGTPQIVESDENGQSAFDLINESYKSAQLRLKKNLEQAQSSLSCLDQVFDKNISEISNPCQKTFQDVHQASIANQRARLSLAIALPDQAVLTDLQYKTINTNLNPPVTSFKIEKWNPLSKSEKEFVLQNWDDFIKKTGQTAQTQTKDHFNFTSQPVGLNYTKNLIQQKRDVAMMNYHLDMSRYPLIQFLKSDQPEKDEFKIAYSEVIKNIQNEMLKIKDKQNNLVLNPKRQVSPDDLFILNYQTTEDFLSEHPKYCSIAQSLMEYQKNKQLYISAGTAIAFVGATLTGQIPAAVIFATGSALSGYNTYESYTKYKAAMQAHLSATSIDDQILTKSAVDKNKNEMTVQGTLALGSSVLSLPLKMSHLVPQTKVAARTQMLELIEGQPHIVQPLSADKLSLLTKIDSLEREALRAFNETQTEVLKNTGRGIGKEVIFRSKSGAAEQGFILRYAFEDDKTWAIIGQKVIVNGKEKVIQVRVPAMGTLPVNKP